ncbi:hypothetical protein KCV00_g17, partial [Aureobasidium melanogenum]
MAMVATKVRGECIIADSEGYAEGHHSCGPTNRQDDDPGNSHGDDMAVHDSGMLYLSKLQVREQWPQQ